MKITIGKFDAVTKTVTVTFSHNGVRHRRPVNACLDADGNFDAEATTARVEDVGSGVAYKIEMGLIAG